jgi:two-component system, OmpR family, sensor histidine kinase KdpD
MRIRGVLMIRTDDRQMLRAPEQRRHLDTIAALVAIALERVHYVEVASRTQLGMESERLRNSLLGALSHDIRTPLTALVGLADTLSMRIAAETPDMACQADAIRVQAHRISQLGENLLEMARLQGGAVRLNRDWQSIEELVGGALEAIEPALGGRAVHTDLPAALPLVFCDAILLERVLVNLLENAVKYTPPGSPIAISARVGESEMMVRVADEGPGVPHGREEATFGKFQRASQETVIPGVGLGLAISRAIIEAHRGRIFVENTRAVDGRVLGASFTFALQLEGALSVEAESPSAEIDVDPALSHAEGTAI